MCMFMCTAASMDCCMCMYIHVRISVRTYCMGLHTLIPPPQTKKLKEEREAKKIRDKKARDRFLLMLAENTLIDTSSRYDQAREVLKKDERYHQVESEGEREELFREFLNELRKKEREEREKLKIRLLERAEQELKDLVEQKKISSSASWSETVSFMHSFITPPLDEAEVKRIFHRLLDDLKAGRREAEKKRREALHEKIRRIRTETEKAFGPSVKFFSVRNSNLSHQKILFSCDGLGQGFAYDSSGIINLN
ncbi:hypothetical protein EON64_18565 [archaeon]|nr:MAG: hypothetical protein EON64_18565 [archaeon]